MNFVAVFFGGGIGCVVRYLINLVFHNTAFSLPLATFISNITACIIFAVVLWLTPAKESVAPHLRLLLITGFCGGLSTFSAFSHETFLLLKQQLYFFAALNVLLSPVICVLIFFMFHHNQKI